MLGKNGEPKEGITINLSFLSKKISSEIKITLETDKDGKISLGHLQNYGIVKVISTVKEKGDINAREKFWVIEQLS